MKVAFRTLGCKVNQYETAAIEQIFIDAGYQLVSFNSTSDIYVINTCTVTNLGQSKSRQMIRQAIKRNPEAIIVVTGCYAQTAADEVMEIDGVDLVIGTQDRQKIIQYINVIIEERKAINLVSNIFLQKNFEELSAPYFGERTRATLKIQEGCNNFCSYCIIPYARGGIRSRQLDNIIQQAELMVANGYKEIVLAGIHLGSYGRDIGDISLIDVLTALEDINGLERIRISSIEATEINDDMIELIRKSNKICRHLHIPLQASTDKILTAMNRKYTLVEYERIINKIRKSIPDIAITTDLIVGFPKENEEDFIEGLAFIKRINFADMHIFKYSKRSGTPAAKMPDQVSNAVKDERSKLVLEVANAGKFAFYQKFLNKEVDILVETCWQEEKSLYEGHTDNYIKVIYQGQSSDLGKIIRVKIDEVGRQHCYGRKVEIKNE